MMVVVVFMWVCKGRTITSISAVVGARQIVERASERAYITSWWEGRIVNGVRISAATEQPRVRADEGGVVVVVRSRRTGLGEKRFCSSAERRKVWLSNRMNPCWGEGSAKGLAVSAVGSRCQTGVGARRRRGTGALSMI